MIINQNNLLLQFLLLNLTSSLYYLQRRGRQSFPSQEQQYHTYNVPRHQPPFQVIDRNIHKRRLDVWVPLDDTEDEPKTSTTTKAPKQDVTNHIQTYSKVAPVYQRPPITKSKQAVIKHIKSSKPTPVYNRNDHYERRSDNVQNQQFSTEEIQNLKQNIKSNQYKGIPQPTVSQPTSQGQLLNLLEFCKTNPKDLKHDQYVEVQN